MRKSEKMGVVEWLTVVKRSRALYLRLSSATLNAYDIREHDIVLVELKEIKKAVRDAESG